MQTEIEQLRSKIKIEELRSKLAEQDAEIAALTTALGVTMRMLQCFTDAAKIVGEIAKEAQSEPSAAASKIGAL